MTPSWRIGLLGLSLCLLTTGWGACQTPASTPIASIIDIKNEILSLRVDPTKDGTVSGFTLLATGDNLAGAEGLFMEGFGVANPYVPNRRLNAWWDRSNEYPDRQSYRFSYDCDGGNIAGLHVERIMDLFPDVASVRMTWRISNRGQQRQWLAPWVRYPVWAGGAEIRLDIPTLDGIVQAKRAAYWPASRNWVAVTDPAKKVTLFAVFHAENLHSVLSFGEETGETGFQAALVPRLIEPGTTWETSYDVGAVRGLSHVDFVGGGIAAQIDYATGKLVLLLASLKPMDGIQIHAQVVAPNGEKMALPGKQFNVQPEQLARCTYEWTPPGKGAYRFVAELRKNGKPLPLGKDLGSPSGQIDTQFTVGDGARLAMPAWTKAPHALDRGKRRLVRSLAARDPVPMWFESGLEKVFAEDEVEAGKTVEPAVHLTLARNERESFQLALRPASDMKRLEVQWSDLTHAQGLGQIPASDVACYVEHYLDVRVPSHFEGPTGRWPDLLRPYAPFSVRAGATVPLWFTVHARPETPPGNYSGRIEISGNGLEPTELSVEVKVRGFVLPTRAALKTDFPVSKEAALSGVKFAAAGIAAAAPPDTAQLLRAYLDNAFEHRVSLRDPSMFPKDDTALTAFAERVEQDTLSQATTLAVPPPFLDTPDRLARLRALCQKPATLPTLFVPLAEDPDESAWSALLDSAQHWKTAAPWLPLMTTTRGLRPFLAQTVQIWGVHLPVFDTPSGQDLVAAIQEGKEVWGELDHLPPRPYANFFLDSDAIEHRVLFWQLWGLGVKGLHYWSINAIPEGNHPLIGVLDTVPVNGDGMLVYPGPAGPINSIRWEIIRDGIEDYDYLALLRERRRKLLERSGKEAVLKRLDNVFDLRIVFTSLSQYEHGPEALLAKREQIGAMIDEADNALK